jgi:hypothetical protein
MFLLPDLKTLLCPQQWVRKMVSEQSIQITVRMVMGKLKGPFHLNPTLESSSRRQRVLQVRMGHSLLLRRML